VIVPVPGDVNNVQDTEVELAANTLSDLLIEEPFAIKHRFGETFEKFIAEPLLDIDVDTLSKAHKFPKFKSVVLQAFMYNAIIKFGTVGWIANGVTHGPGSEIFAVFVVKSKLIL
jgi:hypothetical protein